MRYDQWDAILFPRDSHVPIQEFRTACYVACDEYGRQLPTLTCYIASLPPTTPFRISLHSWNVKAKPTAVIESRRKPNQRVVYAVSVTVDGTRVFHNLYDLSSKWPQEIVSEKRSIALPSRQSSQRRLPLEFPPFRHNVLMQSCWDPRDNSGRIKVLLSEQLVGQSRSPTELEFGATNDVVCFLFQHAPRDILEQAGIAWPIRNPLYLPSAVSDTHPQTSQAPSSSMPSYVAVSEDSSKSTASKKFRSPFERPPNPEPGARPNTASVPETFQFPKPPAHDRGRKQAQIWEQFIVDSVDDSSVEGPTTWREINSRSATDSMPHSYVASPLACAQKNIRQSQPGSEQTKRKRENDHGRGNAYDERRHVYVTFQEDQFGRLVEAFSPSKTFHSPYGPHGHGQGPQGRGSNPSPVLPSAVGGMNAPVNMRPSPSGLAHTATHPGCGTPPQNNVDGRTHVMEKNKGSMPEHGSADAGDNRNVNAIRARGTTTHPFVHEHVWESSNLTNGTWGTDAGMRDGPPIFTNMARLENTRQQPTPTHNYSPVPPPSAHGSIKSRKEGMCAVSPAAVPDAARHDKSLLPTLDVTTNTTWGNGDVTPKPPANTPASLSQTDRTSALTDLERVESELLSAFGEELHCFDNENINPITTATDDDILPGLEDFESPPAKRRRSGVLGEETERGQGTKPLEEARKDRENLQGPQMRGH